MLQRICSAIGMLCFACAFVGTFYCYCKGDTAGSHILGASCFFLFGGICQINGWNPNETKQVVAQ